MEAVQEPLLIRVEEAARLLNLSRGKAYQLIMNGELPSVVIGRSRRVSVEALRRFVEEHERGQGGGDDA